MDNPKVLLTDEQIESAWGNASFGDSDKRDIVANGLLKYACGYGTGHTIYCILRDLKLVNARMLLTTLGKQYLYAHFSGGLSV